MHTHVPQPLGHLRPNACFRSETPDVVEAVAEVTAGSISKSIRERGILFVSATDNQDAAVTQSDGSMARARFPRSPVQLDPFPGCRVQSPYVISNLPAIEATEKQDAVIVKRYRGVTGAR